MKHKRPPYGSYVLFLEREKEGEGGGCRKERAQNQYSSSKLAPLSNRLLQALRTVRPLPFSWFSFSRSQGFFLSVLFPGAACSSQHLEMEGEIDQCFGRNRALERNPKRSS